MSENQNVKQRGIEISGRIINITEFKCADENNKKKEKVMPTN